MKVQRIRVGIHKFRYLLLNDEGEVVESVFEYMMLLESKNLAPNTRKNYCHHIKLYFEYLIIIYVEYYEICDHQSWSGLDILSAFVGHLRHHNHSDNTINIIMTAVLGFYDYLALTNKMRKPEVYMLARSNKQFRGFLEEILQKPEPIPKSILRIRTTKPELKFITRLQYQTLIKACNNIRDMLIISIMFEGGLRIGEALGLYFSDIIIGDNSLIVTPRDDLENEASVKRKGRRELYIPRFVMQLYLNYYENERGNIDNDFVFVNLRGRSKGSPMKTITVEKLFERLSKKVGFYVHPHMCRHGHGTELHNAGWDIPDIAMRFGHESYTSTKKYIHPSVENLRERSKQFFQQRGVDENQIH